MLALVGSEWEDGRLVFRRKDTKALICAINPSRLTRLMTVSAIVTDDDTITAAMIQGGIITYAADNDGGDLTFDSAQNIEAAFPTLQVGEVLKFYIINTGGFTGTLAADGGATITLANVGQTIAANEAAMVLLRKTAADAFTAYIVGA